MTNIFICLTPLHALIAEKILELEKINNFILIYYYEIDNAKHRYYYERLAKNARRAFYLHKNNKIFSACKTFFFLYLELKKEPRPVSFFAGNLKTIYSRIIIFLTGFKYLYSFDDGLGNISGEGYIYEGRNPGKLSGLLSFTGIHFTYASMINRIKKHYTLYPLENAMPNAVLINLFGNNYIQEKSGEKEAVVLLTGPFSEYKTLSRKEEKMLYKKIIEKFNVSHIIPHPADQEQKINSAGIEIIHSEKIAEDILLDLRKQYKNIKVLGIYSTALMNLSGIKGIEIINVHYRLKFSYDRMRALFSSLNIKTENIDSVLPG